MKTKPQYFSDGHSAVILLEQRGYQHNPNSGGWYRYHDEHLEVAYIVQDGQQVRVSTWTD